MEKAWERIIGTKELDSEQEKKMKLRKEKALKKENRDDNSCQGAQLLATFAFLSGHSASSASLGDCTPFVHVDCGAVCYAPTIAGSGS